MDPISDIFRTMHVQAFGQHRLEATAPWGLVHKKQAGQSVAGSREEIPETDVVHFAMLSRGNCWLSVEGASEPIPLTGGDCFLLSHDTSIVMSDSPRTRPRSTFAEVAANVVDNVAHYGGGGAPTTIVCGSFSFDRASLRPISQLLAKLHSDQVGSGTYGCSSHHAAGAGIRNGRAGTGIGSRRDSACRGSFHPDPPRPYRFGART